MSYVHLLEFDRGDHHELAVTISPPLEDEKVLKDRVRQLDLLRQT